MPSGILTQPYLAAHQRHSTPMQWNGSITQMSPNMLRFDALSICSSTFNIDINTNNKAPLRLGHSCFWSGTLFLWNYLKESYHGQNQFNP